MIDGGELIRKLALHAARSGGLVPLARRLFGGIGAIMMLHSVSRSPAERIGANRHLVVSPDFLDLLLGELRRLGYVFVSMDEAHDRIRSPRARERFVSFTADDGYRDNLSEALPIFERHGAPLTIHIAPALTDGEAILWWDVLEEVIARRERVVLPLPDGEIVFDCSTPARKLRANDEIHERLTTATAEQEQRGIVDALAKANGLDCLAPISGQLMDWDEIARAARHPLVTIGAHTIHHYNLSRLPEEQAAAEISGARAVLAQRLGEAPRHMAYPYGYAAAVGEREVRLARDAGFDTAVTTRHGLLQAEHAGHPHALPRISVNGRYQRVAHVETMLSGITTPLANFGRRVVTV